MSDHFEYVCICKSWKSFRIDLEIAWKVLEYELWIVYKPYFDLYVKIFLPLMKQKHVRVWNETLSFLCSDDWGKKKHPCFLLTRSSTGESTMIQNREQTVYLSQPRSIRPGWRTCCQTLTTSLKCVPSMGPASDPPVNTVRCSQREHVRAILQ